MQLLLPQPHPPPLAPPHPPPTPAPPCRTLCTRRRSCGTRRAPPRSRSCTRSSGGKQGKMSDRLKVGRAKGRNGHARVSWRRRRRHCAHSPHTAALTPHANRAGRMARSNVIKAHGRPRARAQGPGPTLSQSPRAAQSAHMCESSLQSPGSLTYGSCRPDCGTGGPEGTAAWGAACSVDAGARGACRCPRRVGEGPSGAAGLRA
jgi:hypothetical protein